MRLRENLNIRVANFDFTTCCPWCDPDGGDIVDEDDDERESMTFQLGASKKTREEHIE